MKGVAPVTPDPKMHMNSLSQQLGGTQSYTWFESNLLAKDFPDLKADMASPMFMPNIIKESPRVPLHHQVPHQHGQNYNITVNYNDYSNRNITPLA